MKIKKPKEEQNPDPRLHSLHYTLNDLYVGAIVNFNSHHFLITAADEYVFAYMQRDSEKEKVTDDIPLIYDFIKWIKLKRIHFTGNIFIFSIHSLM